MNNSNRDRLICKGCIYEKMESCTFVKIDGSCSMTGKKVAKDYTYGKSLKDGTIHR